MSVLEKIVKAEKAASALLIESREKANMIIANAHDELDVLKVSKAKEVTLALNVFGEEANQDIALLGKKIKAEKEKVIAAINASNKTRKQKIVDEIFKDITVL